MTAKKAIVDAHRCGVALRRILEEECQLQRRYLDTLDAELQELIAYHPEGVEKLARKREELAAQIARLNEARMDMVGELCGDRSKRLSLAIQTTLPAQEARPLAQLAQQLGALVANVQAKTKEYSGVTQFSLRVLASTISLLWSGTQTVNRVYSRSGEMRESPVPSPTRSQGTLKQA